MVMMGQQLMDSERKQEDDEIDDYLIRPPNNNPNNRATTTEEQNKNNNSQETMKKREVPTLASLAQETHQKLMGSSNGISDDQEEDVVVVNGTSGEGDNNNKVIKKHTLELVVENGTKIITTANGSAKMNGHIQNHMEHHSEQDRPSDFQTSPVGGGVGGEAITTTSSGRTSSCDSSGVGTSLTSSSSSEPVEREQVLSPSSDHEGDGVPIVVVDSNRVVDEDVPDNGNGNCSSDDTIVTTIPNGVESASDSSQALLLCEDYNEQMTAAKKFLKMVRDGINENGCSSSSGTKPLAAASSRLKSGDSSTDEDATISSNSTVTNKQTTILSNGTTGSNNVAVINSAIINANPKEKSNASTSASNGRSVVIPAILAAALNKNIPVLERDQAPSCVQEVWAYNLLEEFAKIRRVVKQYTFIAMDTEFPGEIDENKYCGKLYGFHMNEDGTKDEGWSEIAVDNLLDATSPKPPPPSSRTSTSNNGTTPSSNTLHTTPTQSSQHSSSSAVGNSSDNR